MKYKVQNFNWLPRNTDVKPTYQHAHTTYIDATSQSLQEETSESAIQRRVGDPDIKTNHSPPGKATHTLQAMITARESTRDTSSETHSINQQTHNRHKPSRVDSCEERQRK